MLILFYETQLETLVYKSRLAGQGMCSARLPGSEPPRTTTEASANWFSLSCSLIILLVANLPWFICGCTEVSKIERLPHAGSQRHWRVTRSRLSSRANPSSRSKCRAPSSVRALAVNTSPATPRGGHGHLLALLLHERRLP